MTRSAGELGAVTHTSCHQGNGAAGRTVDHPERRGGGHAATMAGTMAGPTGEGMGLLAPLRGGGAGGSGRRSTLDRGSHRTDLAHLEQFVATRRGVEGYVEPRTAVTETTIVLVAAHGEGTRRRLDGPPPPPHR